MKDVNELISKLVSIPSQLGETSDIEEFVASTLDKVKDAEVEMVKVGDLGNDILARVSRDASLPTILINGHLDTVEVCQGWTRDPFRPGIEEGRLYGLGSADMKAGVAIAMKVFEMLARSQKANVIFAGTIDEEGDSAGAFALLDEGLEPCLCLIPEPSNLDIMMGCRGRVVFEANVRGASAHGARPEEGVNAITEASRLVGKLGSLPLVKHEKLGTGSYCVLEMIGGTRTLSVPDSCRMKIDRHYVTGESKDSLLADIQGAARELDSSASFDIGFWKERQTPFLEPYLTGPTELVSGFIERVGARISYGKSVGDYNVFAKVAPTLVYGPEGHNWHSADEYVVLESIERCLQGYSRFIDSL